MRPLVQTTPLSCGASPIASAKEKRQLAMGPKSVVEALEPTYTPTTRRISKAKKGKRVHVCDKCEKVSYLRADMLGGYGLRRM